MKTIDLFKQSKNLSTKWKKYFEVYDQIFEKYKEKKIIFVEVGVLNGGSLEIWKKYFHPESRIIGIDLNPDTKKFEKNGVEIYIGDQSNPQFWSNFFKEVGNIDILLDDGGHTNLQQIITLNECIKNINDEGILITEDTHTSYMQKFANPGKYSFINYTKKIIDDINFKFPNIGAYKYSLNDYIYSIQYFESIVVFNVNKSKTKTNIKITNKLSSENKIKDFRYHNSFTSKIFRNKYLNKFFFLKKNKFISFLYNFFLHKFILFENLKDKRKIKIFFK
jgi:hypothetical protein